MPKYLINIRVTKEVEEDNYLDALDSALGYSIDIQSFGGNLKVTNVEAWEVFPIVAPSEPNSGSAVSPSM